MEGGEGYGYAIRLELEEVTDEDTKIKLLNSKPFIVNIEPQKRAYCLRRFKTNQTKLNYKVVEQNGNSHERLTCTVQGCDKTYAFISDLWEHINAVHNGNAQGCPRCGKMFSKKSNATKHIREKICLQNTQRTCKTCGQNFLSQNALTTHIHHTHPKEVFSKAHYLSHLLSE